MKTLIASLVIVISACFLCPGQEVQMLTSNDVFDITGAGDTVWLRTGAGLNFTIDTGKADTVSWWGYTGTSFYGIAYGGGYGLGFQVIGDNEIANQFWLYSQTLRTARSFSFPWSRSNLEKLPTDTQSLVSFYCRDAVWDSGVFWLASDWGGIVKYDPVADTSRLWAVNCDTAFSIAAFPPKSDTILTKSLMKSANQVLSVKEITNTPYGSRIVVMTPKRMWLFNPDTINQKWDTLTITLSDPVSEFDYRGLYVDNSQNPAGLYAAIARGDSDIVLYKYDSSASPKWIRFYQYTGGNGPVHTQAVAIGKNGTVYIADSTRIFAFFDTTGVGRLPFTTASIGEKRFTDRMVKATLEVDFGSMDIRSIACFTNPADTAVRMWIGTSQGVFFSRDEVGDEHADSAFRCLRRAPKVKGGLKETYAYPGILTWQDESRAARTYFAYNLSADAKVTIRIYDWNMDLVKTVIDKEPRIAGTKRQSGRSTDMIRDFWDGTNIAGTIVAPGVYYYAISTDAGGRARGKIVVALSR